MDLSQIGEFMNKVELEGLHDKLNVGNEEVEDGDVDSSLNWGSHIVKALFTKKMNARCVRQI